MCRSTCEHTNSADFLEALPRIASPRFLRPNNAVVHHPSPRRSQDELSIVFLLILLRHFQHQLNLAIVGDTARVQQEVRAPARDQILDLRRELLRRAVDALLLQK